MKNAMPPANIKVVVDLIDKPDPDIIAQVATLEEEAFGRGGLNEWHLPVIARHGRLYVLVEEDNIVGAASIIRDWTANKAYLFDLVIAKDSRRRGYARFLMQKVIAELRREGVKRLELTVAPGSSAAVGLYKRLGLAKMEMLKDEYGRGHDRWAMALTL